MKHISKVRIVLLLVAAAGLMAGCMPKPHKFEPQKGDGNIVSRTLEVSDFHTIVMEMPVELHYVESEKPFLRITGDSNLIAAMNPRVERGILVLAVCWPERVMVAHNRFTMLPTQPLVVEAGSAHVSDFGWNLYDCDARQMFAADKVPYYGIDRVDLPGDSAAALTVVKLAGEPMRLDVCYGTVDSTQRYLDQLIHSRSDWKDHLDAHTSIYGAHSAIGVYTDEDDCDLLVDTIEVGGM